MASNKLYPQQKKEKKKRRRKKVNKLYFYDFIIRDKRQ